MTPPVRHQVFIAETPARLYERLSSGSGWERWFAQEARFGARPGEPVYFRWDNFGPEHYSAEDHGVVVELEPPRRIAFTWSPAPHPTQVTMMFESRGDGCLLSLEESGYHDSREDLEVALAVAAGWGEALLLLKLYVETGWVYGPTP